MNIDNNFQQPFKQDQEYFGDDSNFSFSLSTTDKIIELPCQCGHSIARFYKDEDGLSVAFYVYTPSSFAARIKKAWKLLFKGERVLLDDIVIDQSGIDKLKEFLK